MAHEINRTQLLAGLDMDSENRTIESSSYRYALNLRNSITESERFGTATNCIGNVPVSKYTFPYGAATGTSKVIGYCEDTQYNTIIFFVWNSNDEHSIMRYYRDSADPTATYGEVQQVVKYDFGWDTDTRITSANIVYGTTGDLLYWTDNVMPRKINLSKGNVVNKKKCWDFYLPVTIDGNVTATTTFTFKNFAGTTVHTKTVNTTNKVTVTDDTLQYFEDGGRYYILAYGLAGTDLSGVSSFTISGSSNVLNNTSYTIVGWEDIFSGLVLQIEVTTIPVTGFFDANVVTLQWNIPADEAREQILKRIAGEFVNDLYIDAEACGCHLELCEKTAGTIWTVTDDQAASLIVPSNWYGATLIERFFDRCKYPFLNAPQMLYAKDALYEPNYVKNKVFQSRLQPFYDDDESQDLALGVWSQIPINNLGCDGTSDPSYNYIDIDFNDTTIANEQTLVLLKKITLVMCEHSGSVDQIDGLINKNRQIITLEPCDFLDYENGAWKIHYKFYNDIISSPVNAALAAKLFDNVPLKSDAELFVKNKVVEAGILEGYDAPECVKAKAQVEFATDPNPTLYEISGFIRIFNPFGDNNSARTPETTIPNILERRMPIVFDSTAFGQDITPYPFFGGVTVEGGTTQLYFNDAANGKRQLLPEGGFPVYAAGTDYFTVSRQKTASNTQQRSDGAIDASNDGNKDQLRAFYQTSDDLYSNFSLKVPAGEYIIRLGSHWCSFNDKLGKGFPYNLSLGRSFQQTSTFVWGVIDNGGTWKYDFELKVTVTDSDVFIGEFIVSDLVVSNVDSSGLFQSISGYVFDSNGQVDVPALAQGVTVEKGFADVITELPIDHPTYQSKNTDHNGFFYFQYALGSGNVTPDDRVKVYQVGGAIHDGGTQYFEDVTGLSALSRLFDESINTDWQRGIEGSVNQRHREIICPVDDPNARNRASTFISGSVVDSLGNPTSGLTVLYEHGRTTLTQTDGSYSLLAWGDVTLSLLNDNRIVDNLFFNGNPSCQPEYPNSQEYSPVLIDPFGINTTDAPPPYSPTANYPIPDFTVNHNADPTQKALKRGGNDLFGGRGYDDAGRLCSVFPLFELYTPFITEDIGRYGIEDFGGAIYPSDTFRYGKPTVRIVLDSSTIFPSWMKYFQIMRTKNTIYGRYLQWVANEVTYVAALATSDVPEIKTTFQNRNATAIKISIKNIIDYSSQNNNSTIGYQYQVGDRLRIITDRNLEYINGLNDFEVTSYDSTTQEVIIKPEGFTIEIQSGCLFEIFNPKSVATDDEQIFYECGDVITVTNGVPDRYVIDITGGDTYWRGRLITVNDEATKFAAAYPVVIEDASVSDFYPSLAQDIGRVGIIDPNFKQLYNPSKLRVSNQYTPDTAINGLSSFEELNQKTIDRAFGSIKRLIYTDNNLVCVMENREVSNYIGLVTLMQASQGAEAGLIATSDNFFGTDYVHKQMLGTDFAGSVTVSNEGVIFGYNNRSANAWKYTGEETNLSDAKMINYFTQLANTGATDVTSIFDRYHEEYLITVWRKTKQTVIVTQLTATTDGYDITGGTNLIPALYQKITAQISVNGVYRDYGGVVTSVDGQIFTIHITTTDVIQYGAAGGLFYGLIFGTPETIAWCEPKKRWTTFYSFTPECYGILGSELFSFKDGQIYIHDTNETRNNFYGTQYKTKVTPVFNMNPELVKVWNACTLKTKQVDNRNDWSVPVIRNDNNQLSRLQKGAWVKKEENWYAHFKRDLNTVGVVDPIVNGRALRSSSLVCEMENDATVEMRLYSWDANMTKSERTE